MEMFTDTKETSQVQLSMTCFFMFYFVGCISGGVDNSSRRLERCEPYATENKNEKEMFDLREGWEW